MASLATTPRTQHLRRLAIVLTVTALAFAGLAGVALAQELMRITQNVHATADDAAPTRTYTAPYVLVSPEDSRVVVAATAEMRSRTCHLLRSADAGQSWTLLDASPSPESFPFCFHTSGITTVTPMAWGSDEMLYYAMAGWDVQDSGEGTEHGGTSGNLSVLLARSADLGDSWERTVVRNTRGFEGEETETNRPISDVAVDTSGSEDVVYVGWNTRLPQSDQSGGATLAVSTDGGETFGDPIRVVDGYAEQFDEPGEVGAGPPALAVADDGTLYVLFLDSGTGEPRRLVLARSTDRGQTFEYTPFDDPALEFSIAPVLAWGPGGGPDGTVHIAYEDNFDETSPGMRDIAYRRSTDAGATLSDPVQLNDDEDPRGVNLQATPQLSVAPNGRIDAAWFDFRDDPGDFMNDVYYAHSNDHGATWSDNVRVSDQSSSRRLGPWTNGFDMRGPVGVGSASSHAVLVWDDTRLGDELNEVQDLFAATAQFEPIGPGALSRWLTFAIAALTGLLGVGIVLLVVSWLLPGRRKRASARVERDAALSQTGGGPPEST